MPGKILIPGKLLVAFERRKEIVEFFDGFGVRLQSGGAGRERPGIPEEKLAIRYALPEFLFPAGVLFWIQNLFTYLYETPDACKAFRTRELMRA